jgi:predicted transcriptional regulator
MDNMKRTDRDEKERYYRMITCKLTPDLDQRLREVANNQKVSMSEVIRQSLSVALTGGQAIEL